MQNVKGKMTGGAKLSRQPRLILFAFFILHFPFNSAAPPYPLCIFHFTFLIFRREEVGAYSGDPTH